MIDYETVIPYLIREKFEIEQMRGDMYRISKPYYRIPNVLFFLKKNEKEQKNYEKIQQSIETFDGNIKCIFGRAVSSKKNYVIWRYINRF